MGATILAPGAPNPATAVAPIIRVAPTWGAEWITVGTRLTLEDLRVCVASEGHAVATLHNRYGTMKLPEETAFGAARDALQFNGWWVQVYLWGPGGLQLAFMGRVFGEERRMMGNAPDAPAGANVRRGLQTWTAFGATLELERAPLREAIHLVGAEERTVGWTPGFNKRDRRGLLVGNRSATTIASGTYAFGGDEVWTRRQAIDYVLKNFAQVDENGPEWSVGGQTELLDVDLEDVDLDAVQSVYDVLRLLLPRSAGLDWKVIPAIDGDEVVGFEVHVMALLAVDVSFRGTTLPKNPNTLEVVVGRSIDLVDARISRDSANRYSTVRLVGARVLVCATLRGTELAGDLASSTLRKRWDSALETEYKLGAAPTVEADENAEAHDSARRADRFRPVYQRFGAPAPWSRDPNVAPALDGEGNVLEGEAADVQEQERSTLSWIPLREGLDYSTDPATDENPAEVEADFRPPLVIGSDQAAEGALGGQRYAPVDALGVGVSVQKTDLGVQLHAHPNHKVAAGSFNTQDSGTSESEFQPEGNVEAIRPESIAATIAWRHDARLVLESTVPDGDGSVIELAAPDAELWVLAPDTIVDVDAQGSPKTSGPTLRVLRNDADRLALRMAGAIARYCISRARASLTYAGLKPWADLVGHLLTVTDDAGDTQQVQAMVTSVQIQAGNGSPRTIISAGYAG
jgi:hypothetical protein